MPSFETVAIEAAGRTVEVSSPGKVFFSERGETKLDLIRYYLAVEAAVMGALGGRPVLMERYPNGAGGPSFFQKRVPANAPEWLQTTTVQTPNGTPSRALVVADVATPLEYEDQPTYVRALGSAGPCVMIARQVGQKTFDETLVAAAAPYRRDDGSYRLDNIFRFAVARVR